MVSRRHRRPPRPPTEWSPFKLSTEWSPFKHSRVPPLGPAMSAEETSVSSPLEEIKSFFCSDCRVLLRNDAEIYRHTVVTGHHNFWISMEKVHKLYCMKCNEKFKRKKDKESHSCQFNMDYILMEELVQTPMAAQRTMSSRKTSVQKLKVRCLPKCNILIDLSPRRLQYDESSKEAECRQKSDHDDDSNEDPSDVFSPNPIYIEEDTYTKSDSDYMSDDSTEKDAEHENYPGVYLYRTLKNLKMDAEKRKDLRSKYIIAEAVSREVALHRVNKALELYKDRGYFKLYSKGSKARGKQPQEAYTFDDDLNQVCIKKLEKYICSSGKGLRMKNVLEIIKGLLEPGSVGARENTFHYMYHKELNEPGLSDKVLKKRINEAILNLSEMLKVSRESFNIRPASKGLILGPLKLFTPGKLLSDCTLGGSTGCLIPSEVDIISDIDLTGPVKFVLVIEKDTVFSYLAEKNSHLSENCVILCGKGQPDVATRILLRKLRDKLPMAHFYALVDFNPGGLGIFWTYCFGSDARAHDSLLLTVPSLELIGLHREDVSTEELKKFDGKDGTKIITMLNKTYFLRNKGARVMLLQLNALRKKADIDILMKRNILVDVIKERIRISQMDDIDNITGQLQDTHLQHT